MRYNPHSYQTVCEERVVQQEKVGLFMEMGLGPAKP